MKKLLSLIVLGIILALPFTVGANDGSVPVITEAAVQPNHVTGGETVVFMAKVEDPTVKNTNETKVGVFFLHESEWVLITPLRYSEEEEAYFAAVQIPRHAPNGEVQLYFVAVNGAGESSEPVARKLYIYSLNEIIVTQARGCLLSDEIGDVKNFHRGDAESKMSVEGGLQVPLGNVVIFQSHYDGVWYDNGNGEMATTIQMWVEDAEGQWIPLGRDAYRSRTLEGANLRHGVAQIVLPCRYPGEFRVKMSVTSSVHPAAQEDPMIDHDEAIFVLNVVEK